MNTTRGTLPLTVYLSALHVNPQQHTVRTTRYNGAPEKDKLEILCDQNYPKICGLICGDVLWLILIYRSVLCFGIVGTYRGGFVPGGDSVISYSQDNFAPIRTPLGR